MKKTLRSIIIFSFLFLPHAIYAADTYKVFQSGRFDAYLDAEYFKTQSNYDANGNKQDLTSGYSFQDIQFQTSARYVFFNNIGFYSGLNFGNVESNNTINNRTKSILTHVFLGADYQIWNSDLWSFYADLSYWYPNDKVEINQDTALASDGANELKAQFVGVLKSNSFRSFARLGYDNRSEGLSSLLLYGLGGEFFMGSAALGAEIEGFSSITDDQQTSTPANRDTLISQVNAGSKRYYSINPNLLETSVYFSYAIDPNFIMKVNAGTTLIGSNSAEGFFAGASVNWGFGGKGKNPRRRVRIEDIENKSNLPDSEPGFKIETNDGVNQDLFKPSEPIKQKK